LNDGECVELKNIAETPGNSYEIDTAEVLPYLTAGRVAGTWHTHPGTSPQLSGEDYAGFLGWPELKHHIIGVEDGKTVVKCYQVRNGAILECD
jgi:proteasome lid subunit RPN8/RPN11